MSAAATAYSGWRGEQLRRQRAWEMDAGARRAAAEGAGRMSAEAHSVVVLHGEGADTVVVRLPGVRVRRGTDLVLEPEVFPARDVVALMPGGECAIDVRGRLFDVSTAEAARESRPCTWTHAPPPGWNRPEVPESVTYPVEVAISDEVGCARERTGPVRCWGPILRDQGIIRRDVAVPLDGVGVVERLVPLDGRLCALQGGTVLCWGGASRHPARGATAGLPRPIPMGTGVTELVSFDHGWHSRGPMCALHDDGAVRCWDQDVFATPPWEVGPRDASRHSLVVAYPHLCALDHRARAWCAPVATTDATGFVRAPVFDGALLQSTTPAVLTADESGGDRQAAFREALGSGVAASTTTGVYLRCELGVNRRVACRWIPVFEDEIPEWDIDPHEVITSDETVRLVPGIDDAVEFAVTEDGLACARLGTGRVACWGRNVGGVLTAAESARAPSSYTVEELLARVPSR